MKDGADKEFSEAIIQSGLGTLERLPKNCQATHVFRQEDSDHVLPLKFFLESQSRRWSLLQSKYSGIIVLWLTSYNCVLTCHSSELITGSTTSSRILDRYEVSSCTDFVSKLVATFGDYSVSLKDVLGITKYKVVSREETLSRPSTNAQEAVAHEEIIAIVGSDHWKETPEKCHADGGFFIDDPDLSLPTQTKTCTFKTDGVRLNNFHNTSGYDGMILMCRPMTRVYIGTFILPGVLAPKNLTVTLTAGSKYMPYLVQDTQLNAFLTGLHAAVADRQETYVWPSGTVVSISDLELVTHNSLCMPPNMVDIVERQNHEWRLTVLPDFKYEFPKVQGTAVDVLMNNVRIQDKPAHSSVGHTGLHVRLGRSSGKIGRKRASIIPYSSKDFDALFVFLPDRTQFFFVIPAQALMARGYLSTTTSKGKLALLCYPHNFAKSKYGKPDLWTQQYCFDLQDPDVHAKVAVLLESCVSIVVTEESSSA